MAKLTFTADDGSVQDFNVVIPVAAPIVPDVQGVSLEDIQKEQADLAVVEADVTAEIAEVTPVPVVEAPVEPTA